MKYKYNSEASADENIAYGLLAIANELSRLGNGDAATSVGAMENLGLQIRGGLKGISGSLDGVAESIGYLKKNDDE
ncbi:hypothetical protein [Maridesulfovibrio sp.]|uniref:hypothetical protein n=1 Tax=Maridesulfovibrio sp. TaxID=2795000 RepID=UPI003B00251A